MESLSFSLYYLSLFALAIFSSHRVWMVLRLKKLRGSYEPKTVPIQNYPFVTVQLPIFNEKFVARRLIESACALDYPKKKLEIQVLDDSTDETRRIIDDLVLEKKRIGFQICVLRREGRKGFKAGALAKGLKESRGDFLAIFDADFLPDPSFLKSVLPYFSSKEVGMVQARWKFLNEGKSFLTRTEATMLDGHFAVEHLVRSGDGLFFNFNGTAGVWRKACIEEAGGWQFDTLTEDLDLSYRAQMKGWRFVYAPKIGVPSELPVSVGAFRTQQFRWAKGSAETARKLLRMIFHQPLSYRHKIEAALHLLNNWAYFFVLLLALVTPLTVMQRYQKSSIAYSLLDFAIFLYLIFGVALYFEVSQREVQQNPLKRWLRIPWVFFIGTGLSLNNCWAVWEGLMGRKSDFERTPKSASVDGVRETGSYAVRLPVIVWVEFLLGFYLVAFLFLFLANRIWTPLPFLGMMGFGFLYFSGKSLWESICSYRESLAI